MESIIADFDNFTAVKIPLNPPLKKGDLKKINMTLPFFKGEQEGILRWKIRANASWQTIMFFFFFVKIFASRLREGGPLQRPFFPRVDAQGYLD